MSTISHQLWQISKERIKTCPEMPEPENGDPSITPSGGRQGEEDVSVVRSQSGVKPTSSSRPPRSPPVPIDSPAFCHPPHPTYLRISLSGQQQKIQGSTLSPGLPLCLGHGLAAIRGANGRPKPGHLLQHILSMLTRVSIVHLGSHSPESSGYHIL